MTTGTVPAPGSPRGLALLLNGRRLRFTLLFSAVIGFFVGFGFTVSGWSTGFIRVLILGLVAMLIFGLFEQWPKRLPRWLARWVLQVVGVALTIPVATYIIYIISTPAGAPPFWEESTRLTGFTTLTVVGILFATWVALAALVRQKDAIARHQALAFELERSELERRALDARFSLLQAQVAPHFLFNTLANMTLLTLVENAVRHGIDPCEEGGRIDIFVERTDGACRVRVADTGAGLQGSTRGLGTGLSSLRERLRLVFGDSAELHIHGRERGVLAELTFPAIEMRR